MSWQLSDDLEAYVAAVSPLLHTHPERYTISLSDIENKHANYHVSDEPSLYGWWTNGDGAVTGAASVTPPYELLMAEIPEDAAEPLASALAGRVQLPGVNGPRRPVERFATAWKRATSARSRFFMATRLYELDQLSRPDPEPAGAARPATEGDVALLADWLLRFGAETGMSSPGGVEHLIADRLSYGGLTLWEDGEPASVAGHNRPAGGVVRVGPVYTPVERRRRGYAGAVTAAATAKALALGAHGVVLFTNLANDTSNALYQRIGYRPVEDRIILRFDDVTPVQGPTLDNGA